MSTRLKDGGILIDRSQMVEFRFDGKRFSGYLGDSLAAALLANDQMLVGRSFKYHRPRGVVGSGAEEPNALVNLGEGAYLEPNQRATQQPLFDGLVANSQNKFPSLEFDIGAVNKYLWRFFPAGFYYKTFMWPRSFWKHIFEPVIRQSAGLGKAPKDADPDRYEHFYAHYDVVVAGGGIAGLLAAKAAAQSGVKVLLCEQNPYFGGRALVDEDEIDGHSPKAAIDSMVAELAAMENVTLLKNTMVSGVYDHGYVLAYERIEAKSGPRHRLWRIRTQQIISATGAIERPLAFAGNDVPGVMLASAVRDYLKLWAVSAGDRVVVVTNNDDAYKTAIAVQEAGLLATVVDVRDTGQGPICARAEAQGVKVIKGRAVGKVKGTKRVKAVELCAVNGEGATLDTIDCEVVAMSGGWSPVVHLWSHCGGKLNWQENEAFFVPDSNRPPTGAKGEAFVECVGASNGYLDIADLTKDALRGANAVLSRIGRGEVAMDLPQVVSAQAGAMKPIWVMPTGADYKHFSKAFLDYQNDVKVSDVKLASKEGYQSVEHTKRYTTLGMATDQGKLSNINGLAILAESLGKSIPQVGTTTFRPPYTPISMGSIAGIHKDSLFKPQRKTVIQDWHEANGATWEPVGDWKRPYTYVRDGETVETSVHREIRNTRENVGLLDASTLGKIYVSGPDAAKFLDLMHTNMMSTLGVGKCRYGLMLNENGFITDDGVVARISETEFLCHTTSGGSDRIHAWMEEWLQTEWWDLDVFTTNVTEHYAQIAVVGPKARKLLEALGGMDVSAENLPFMQFLDGELAGIPARAYRISFSGELSYEIAVPADRGREFWDKCCELGAEFGIMPYGTEALHVMRAEKGFIMVGDETDGTVTPLDLNMNWIVSKKKADFLGKRGLERPLFHEENRRQLVGLLTDDPQTVLPHAAPAIEGEGDAARMIGYVTSTYYSPTLERSIAMALVEGGAKRMDETLVFKPVGGETITAKVVDPVFYDKEGSKQNV